MIIDDWFIMKGIRWMQKYKKYDRSFDSRRQIRWVSGSWGKKVLKNIIYRYSVDSEDLKKIKSTQENLSEKLHKIKNPEIKSW